ncbi:DUF6676 family protein [Corynebacterium callunae]|uniref:Rv1476 family membrane protein n=1 Tax=Corynebacterium callunae TaxID=1721 RepID=UPI003981AF38
MIPEDVNIAELAADLKKDAIAIGPQTTANYPQLQQDLAQVVDRAEGGDFGSVGLVYLDHTPAVTSDLRDIAQELLNSTDYETIVVRAPASGAVVSDVHSRAVLEIGQSDLLATNDFVAGADALISDVTLSSVAAIDWATVTIMGAIVLIVAIAIIAAGQWGLRRKAKFLNRSSIEA